MKNVKKISLFFIGLMIFTQITCFESDNNQSIEYPPYNTEKYIYTKTVKTLWPLNTPYSPEVITTEKTIKHYFNDGITHTKTTIETKNNSPVTTTETWISRKPSYITAKNGTILLTALAFYVILRAYNNSYNEYMRKADEDNKAEDKKHAIDDFNNFQAAQHKHNVKNAKEDFEYNTPEDISDLKSWANIWIQESQSDKHDTIKRKQYANRAALIKEFLATPNDKKDTWIEENADKYAAACGQRDAISHYPQFMQDIINS